MFSGVLSGEAPLWRPWVCGWMWAWPPLLLGGQAEQALGGAEQALAEQHRQCREDAGAILGLDRGPESPGAWYGSPHPTAVETPDVLRRSFISGKSGDVTSSVPSYSSIRFTAYAKHFRWTCRRDDHARIRACGGRLSGRRAARSLTFAGQRPPRAIAYERFPEPRPTPRQHAERACPPWHWPACRLQLRAGQVAERLAHHAVDRIQVAVAVAVVQIAELGRPVPAGGVDPDPGRAVAERAGRVPHLHCVGA